MSGLLPRNSAINGGDFDNITCNTITVNSTAIVRTLVAANLSFTNISATNATVSNLASVGSLKITTAPTSSSTLSVLVRETDGTINVNGAIVNLSSAQTLTNKTLTSPNINSPTIASPNIQNLLVDNTATPVGIDGTGVLATITNLVTTTGTQTLSNKSISDQLLIQPSAPFVGSTGSLLLTDGGAPATVTTLTPAQGSDITLTLPATAGTIALTSDIPSLANYVTTNTTQTISAVKTFSAAPVISTITNGAATLTLPTTTDTLVGSATTDVLTNKTINSASNTVQVNGTNINSLVNQDVRSTASPTFNVAICTGGAANLQVGLGVGGNRIRFVNTSTGFSNDILSNITGPGTWTLPSATATFVGDTTTQTLTNKTINNLVTTGTTSSFNNAAQISNYFTGITTVGAVAATVATVAVPNNQNIVIAVIATAKCVAVSAGADLNKIRSFNTIFTAKNIAGTVSVFTVANNAAGDAAYLPTFGITITGTSVNIVVTGLVNNTINYAGTYTTFLTS